MKQRIFWSVFWSVFHSQIRRKSHILCTKDTEDEDVKKSVKIAINYSPLCCFNITQIASCNGLPTDYKEFNFIKNIFICISKMNNSHTDLEEHEVE